MVHLRESSSGQSEIAPMSASVLGKRGNGSGRNGNGSNGSQLSTLDYLSNLPKFRLATNDSSSFAASFDIIHELTANREQYASDDVQLTIYHFPDSLLMLIDQTRAQVPLSLSVNKPGRNPTIVCAMSYGISTLSSHPDVRVLLELKSKLDIVGSGADGKPKDAMLVQGIWNVFDKFAVSTRESVNGAQRKFGIYLSNGLKRALFAVKADLGINFDALSVLCLQVALCDQPWVLAERQREMEASIGEFLRAARIRRRIFETLLAELEKDTEL